MKQYNYENGDLELLALGLFPEKDRDSLLAAIASDPKLQTEYLEIQDALMEMGIENEVEVPMEVKTKIFDSVFQGPKRIVFSSIFKNIWLRVAASVLLVGSILINLYLIKGERETKETSFEESKEALDQRFLAELPFDASLFEELFQYLENDLKINPCRMDYRATKAFLVDHDLDTPENLSFLNKHNGHCDCEVLMNVSQLFPQSNYTHGRKLIKTHRDADIRLSLVNTSSYGSALALNLSTLKGTIVSL